MPSSIAAAWPSPGRFALALILGFALTLAAAWWWGAALIETLLPLTHAALDGLTIVLAFAFLASSTTGKTP